MAYSPPTFDEILTAILDDYRNRVDGADVSADTEIYRRAAVTAGAIWALSYGLVYVENQIFPNTSDTANLERHAGLYGYTRKAAEPATDGTITLTGTNTTVVSAGLSLSHTDGTTYTTTTGGTITGGQLVVNAEADEGGLEGNKSVGVSLTVQSPPAGVDATATIATAFTDGTAVETDAQLLARLLQRIRQGNAGGTASDYELWSLEVAGVIEATCLPLRRGPGTVSVAVFQDDGSGYREGADATLRGEVLAYLDTVRPVCADVDVPELTENTTNCEVAYLVLDDGYVLADVEAEMEAAWRAAVRATAPGGTLSRVQITRALASVEGVANFTLDTPISDVTTTVSSSLVEYLAPGTFSASEGST